MPPPDPVPPPGVGALLVGLDHFDHILDWYYHLLGVGALLVVAWGS